MQKVLRDCWVQSVLCKQWACHISHVKQSAHDDYEKLSRTCLLGNLKVLLFDKFPSQPWCSDEWFK